MQDAELRERTRRTAQRLLRTVTGGTSLTVLHRPHELRAHVHAALDVGCSRQAVTEGSGSWSRP
jgi:hypothetical protein